MKIKTGYRIVSQEAIVIDLPEEFKGVTVSTEYASIEDCKLRIMPKYAWDGISFFIFQIFWTPQWGIVPSQAHDALYQLHQDGKLPLIYRGGSDKVFYLLLIDRRVWRWVAIVFTCAVRWFGNYFARHGRKVRDVY